MSLFFYKLLTPQGEIRRELIDLPFEDSAPAIRYLESRGGVVLNIRRLHYALGKILQVLQMSYSKINRQELAEFFNNLSMMLSAGVPILSAMEEVISDLKAGRLKNTIKLVMTDIEMGHTVSEALSRHKHIFSNLIIYMVTIGEETGRLDFMLKKISEHIRHMDKIINDVKRAVRYPAFLFFIVLAAVVFWFWYVVPQIVQLFQDINIQLPDLTLWLLAVSNYLKSTILWILLMAIVGLIIFHLAQRRIYRVRYYKDLVLLHLPIASTIIHTALVARITENLGLMLSAGVSVMRTLEVTIDSLRNLVYKQKMQAVLDNVKLGQSISESMRRARALDPFAIRMISIGEESGTLDEQSQYVAETYRGKLNNLVESLSNSLEPILLMVLGTIFALIIAGLLLPIYDLVGKVGGY